MFIVWLNLYITGFCSGSIPTIAVEFTLLIWLWLFWSCLTPRSLPYTSLFQQAIRARYKNSWQLESDGRHESLCPRVEGYFSWQTEDLSDSPCCSSPSLDCVCSGGALPSGDRVLQQSADPQRSVERQRETEKERGRQWITVFETSSQGFQHQNQQHCQYVIIFHPSISTLLSAQCWRTLYLRGDG